MSGVKKQSLKISVSASADRHPLPAVTEVLDALPDAVLMATPQGHILFANHAALSFTSLGQNALTSKNIEALFGEAHPVTESFVSVVQSGQGRSLNDLTLCGKSVQSCSLTPMENMPIILVSWRHDLVSLRDEWLDKIRQSLKPAQHLTRMLAHEVRNPLAGIRGAAQLLQKGSLNDDDLALARLIEDETQRIARLVEKVNVFDGVPQGELTPLNIHAVSDHVVGLVRAGICARMTVETKYDPSLPDIAGHKDSLIQAVLNLVKNAAEAGAQHIILRSYFDTTSGFHPESGLRLPVVLEITDDGMGMDDKTLSRLFEPCFTTKPAGEGLGLAIVSQIVDDHGGAMQVTSLPGATTFRIRLPMPKRKRGDR